jgi:repressor LexA
VVVRPQQTAENGEIVAAQFDRQTAEATVKTLQRLDGHVWLMPHNPAYQPIPTDDLADSRSPAGYRSIHREDTKR